MQYVPSAFIKNGFHSKCLASIRRFFLLYNYTVSFKLVSSNQRWPQSKALYIAKISNFFSYAIPFPRSLCILRLNFRIFCPVVLFNSLRCGGHAAKPPT